MRPEAAALLTRWREAGGAVLVVLLGLWVAGFGGWFYMAIGALIAVVGLSGLVIALRRMRFQRAVDQPGVVEVDEGEVRYLGPHGGGFAAIPEIVSVELIADLAGRRWWRLSESGGNVLSVPVAAEGAAALFDVFARLPGLSTGELVLVLDRPGRQAITVWRRSGHRALT